VPPAPSTSGWINHDNRPRQPSAIGSGSLFDQHPCSRRQSFPTPYSRATANFAKATAIITVTAGMCSRPTRPPPHTGHQPFTFGNAITSPPPFPARSANGLRHAFKDGYTTIRTPPPSATAAAPYRSAPLPSAVVPSPPVTPATATSPREPANTVTKTVTRSRPRPLRRRSPKTVAMTEETEGGRGGAGAAANRWRPGLTPPHA